MAMKLLLRSMIVVLAIGNTQISAQTWAEKLGFPKGSRVVILSGREAGVSWESNEANRELLEGQKLSSVETVVTGPWFESFAKWSKDHSDYDIGVSFAMINPYEAPTWPLLTADQGPTTLVDAQGSPWKTDVQLLAQADPEHVKNELDAQIQKAKAAGLAPSHLGTFTGAAFSRFDIMSVFLGAARKYWIPAPVVELTPEMVERFKAEGFPMDQRMIDLIAQYPLPKLDDLKVVSPADTYDKKVKGYCDLLRDVKPGLTLIVHLPAIESRGLQLMNGGDQHRGWQMKMLSEEVVSKTMKEEKLVVTNWREIMRRFDGKPAAAKAPARGNNQQ